MAIIPGTAKNDTLNGTSDDDTIEGLGGNDTLYGEAGDDTLAGGNGVNRLYGGNGDDVFVHQQFKQVSATSSTIADFQQGHDKIDVSQLFDGRGISEFATVQHLLTTTPNGDAVLTVPYTYNSNKLVVFGIAADELKASDFIFDGKTSNDLVIGENGDDALFGGLGDDTVAGAQGNDLLFGEAGDDVIFGQNGINTLYGGAGADIFVEQQFAQILQSASLIADFEKGIDKISVVQPGISDFRTVQELLSTNADGQAVLTVPLASNGNRLIVDGLKAADLDAGDFRLDQTATDDTVEGTSGGDALFGGLGNDYLRGLSGNDLLFGESGDDRLSGGNGIDTLDGGGGNDTLEGGAGNDVFSWNPVLEEGLTSLDEVTDFIAGADRLRLSSTGADTLGSVLTVQVTRDGDDLVLKGEFEGGATSRFVVTGAAAGAELLGLDPTGLGLPIGFGDRAIWGTSGKDTIAGGSRLDLVYGGGGNDKLSGQGGNDTLYGGSGKDSLLGSTGNDRLSGDNDNDKLDGGSGNDSLLGGAGNDALKGNTGNDKLDGGSGNDSLRGDGGNDTLKGGSGNDKLDGGAGHDRLDGGSGNDTLIGGAGNDTLVGGSGNDLLAGGSGRDRFDFDKLTDHTDRISDFHVGSKGDVLDLDGLLPSAARNDVADFVRIVDHGSYSMVQVDVNGSTGGASFADLVRLDKISDVSASGLLDDGNLFVG